MKILFLVSLFFSLLLCDEKAACQDLYTDANEKWIKLQPLLKTKIASKVGWDLIHSYIDAASLTLAECEPGMKLDFRYIRELKQGMIQADKKRKDFKVQTYQQMVNQAKREGKCTLIYRQYR